MKFTIPLLAAATLFASPALACGQKAEIKTIPAGHHTVETVDIVATAQDAGFTTLLAAATAAGLADTLKSEGPFTVFAPTNEAFAALGQDTIDTLLKPENKEILAGILKYHVISGKVKAADLAGKRLAPETLNGAVLIDGTDGVTVNGAKVISADVKASNGVIHVIDTVLMPAS